MKEKLTLTHEKIICFLLLFSPVIDLFNGLCFYKFNIKSQFSPGQIFRAMLLMILIFFYLIYKKENKFLVIFLVLIFFIQEGTLLISGRTNLVKDTLFASKIWLNLILIIFLKQYILNHKISLIKICDCIINAACFISIVIIFTKILNIGVYSYKDVGYKGLFMGLNDITAVLTISTPFILYKMIFCNKKLINIIKFLLIFSSLFIVGTKTGALAAVFFSLYYISISIKLKKNTVKNIFLICLVILIIYIVSHYFFNFYTKTVLERQIYFSKKLDLTSYILSQRNKILEVAFQFWQNKWYYFVTGVGFTQGSTLINSYFYGHGMIEMDFLDILYFYGIFIFMVFAINLFPTFAKTVKLLFKSTKPFNKTFYISFIVAIIISFLGGHVILSPLAGIYLATIFASSYKLMLER